MADPLDRLPPEARQRLERFGAALERVHVDDLPLYAIRRRGPERRRSVERAAMLAAEAGLTEGVEAARSALTEYVTMAYANAQYRASFAGLNTAPGLGPTDDRVRVLRSIGDAVSALVLDGALDEADRAELLGAWDRLLR